ncbi:MAG: sulfatase-like hydrolase/transferase [Planctomycetota bacterium]
MSVPQAVFIMTDTQRRDMFGCYQQTGLQTPHVDALAGQGVRFNNAYCASPVCGPARSSLFTGLYPHSCGGWANGLPLDANTKTIGQRLTDATAGRVATGYIGKWHLDGGDYFGMGRCPEGWDPATWYDMRNYLEELSPADRQRSRQAQSNDAPGGFPEELTFARRCADRAIRFIEEHRDRPFLLVVSFDEPHSPYLCPEPYASMYDGYEFPKSPNVHDDLRDKPELQRIWAGDNLDRDMTEFRIARANYFGCHSFVDFQVGRVVEAIDCETPESLVMFTSDHGDMLGCHRLERSGKGPAVYEEITNVPMVVRWPGCAAAGSVSDALVSHVDVAPTLLSYFGVDAPMLLPGCDQLGVIRGDVASVRQRVFMEFGRYENDHDGFLGFQPIRCVFDGQRKLAINLLDRDEYYDHAVDPHEIENLIEAPPDLARRDGLHDELIDWMNATRDPFRGDCWRRRPWRQDAPPASWAFMGMTRQREHEEYEPRQLDYATGLEMKQAVRPKQ